MWRTLAAIVAGLAAWAVIATILNLGVRLSIPGYIQAEPVLAFTLAMKIARLSLAAIACLGAGAIARFVAPSSRAAPIAVGLILLGMFLPVHLQIWSKLPIWYHLTFLVTLAPLVVLGSRFQLAKRISAPLESRPA